MANNNINPNYKYVFETFGEVAHNLRKNDIWVDIGNKYTVGVYDHHQIELDSSFSAVVLNHEKAYENKDISYLTNAKESINEGASIIFYTHKYPDVDSLFSICFIQKLLESDDNWGGYTFDVVKKCQQYVDSIDNGKSKNLEASCLYKYICTLGFGVKDELKRSQIMLNEGLKIVGMVFDALSKDLSIDLFNANLDDYLDTSNVEMQYLIEYDSPEKYDEDRLMGRVKGKNINLPTKDGTSYDIKEGAIWYELPTGEDSYVWARKDGAFVTVYPDKIKGVEDSDITSVVVSIDPNKENSDDYNLSPIADVLEIYEQIEEEKEFKETGRCRRNHSYPRGEGIFAKLPYSVTNDPWYVNGKENMVCSPRGGSLLAYDRIINIITSKACLVEEYNLIQYDAQGKVKDNIISRKNIFYRDVFDETDDKLSEINQNGEGYLLTIVKVNKELLSYSNVFLKSCCLNMSGRAEVSVVENNLIYLDYHTCLYSDQSITVLAVDDAINTARNDLILDGDILASPICKSIGKILTHRNTLFKIGSKISMYSDKSCKGVDLDRLDDDLVEANYKIQTDRIINNSTVQETYYFISSVLEIELLKESVISASEILVNTEGKKSSKRMEIIMTILSLLAIFSALVDSYDFFDNFNKYNIDNTSYTTMGICEFISQMNIWQLISIGVIVAVVLIFIYLLISWLGKKITQGVKYIFRG